MKVFIKVSDYHSWYLFLCNRIGSFDHHTQIAAPLMERLTTINDALEAFVTELRDYQGTWDDTVVVVVSEFARTLMGNTGNGR